MKKKKKSKRQPFGSNWVVRAQDCPGAPGGHFEVKNQGIFDELVVDNWLHLEQMGPKTWWMSLGDAYIWVELDSSGQPSVFIERGSYATTKGKTIV